MPRSLRRPRRTKTESTDEVDSKTACLCFQDVLQSYQRSQNEEDYDEGDAGGGVATAAANACFELANVTWVSYRIDHHPLQQQQKVIRIRQDHNEACGQHTGGIVWETSYLLLNYLRQKFSSSMGDEKKVLSKYPCGKTVLEVGAGCGLLGIGIYKSKLAKRVILTDTDSVLPNLRYNVQENYSSKHNKKKMRTDDDTDEKVRVCGLDWTRYEEDCRDANILPHSMDMIVGTDVVFSTRFVRPLLETLRYLAHSQTTILLCLQERCPDSHRLLKHSASDYGLMVQDISNDVTQVPTCEWGNDLECCILRLVVDETLEPSVKSQNKRQKRER